MIVSDTISIAHYKTEAIHLIMNSQHEVANSLTKNKKLNKSREKEEHMKQRILPHNPRDESENDSNEESTGDQNIISQPKKQKKIKLNKNENEKKSNSISPNEKENQTIKEKEDESNLTIISDNNFYDKENQEGENEESVKYDEIILNKQNIILFNKFYSDQAQCNIQSIQEQDNYDKKELKQNKYSKDNENEQIQKIEEVEQIQEDDGKYEDCNIENSSLNNLKIFVGKIESNKEKERVDEEITNEKDEIEEDDEEQQDDDEYHDDEQEEYENNDDDDDDDDDDDEDYVITDEEIMQQRNDRLMNLKWSEDPFKSIQIENLDEPINEEKDIEGFDLEYIIQGEQRQQYIESMIESLPPYMYCTSQKEKNDFFERLNKQFQRNLQQDTNPLKHSHQKIVKFNFQKAQIVEFDLTKKVRNISKLPVKEGIIEIKNN